MCPLPDPSTGRHAPARVPPLVLLCMRGDELRARVRAGLERSGLSVSECIGAERMLEKCRGLAPAAVLLGPFAEDPNAAAACATLHSREPGLPLIVLVAPGDEPAVQRAYDCGASAFATTAESGELLAQRVRFGLRAAREAAARGAVEAESGRGESTAIETWLEELERAMQRARDGSRSVAVISVEIGNLKRVTAGRGEREREELLRSVARRLGNGIRGDDALARLGCAPDGVQLARLHGEGFGVMIRDLPLAGDAECIGRRVLDLMAEPFRTAGGELTLEAAVGVACHPGHATTAAALLEAAEQAAGLAARGTTGRILSYSSELGRRAAERSALETDLRRAVERGELQLYYQPRVDVRTDAIVGAEALVRWKHPERGMISPLQFVPIAEETGLIVPIGHWILREACLQNRRWQAAGLKPIRVSVNLSPAQFRRPDLYEDVVRVLSETGLSAEALEFEITESLLVSDLDATIRDLRRFRELGVKLSIDDFGTGYSSLSYLKRLPIDALKIDQSFIRELTSSSADSALVTAILLMGRSLKLEVVAEGVETPSQLALLRVLQCDQIQGYLISRPVPAVELEALLRGSGAGLSAA